MSPGYHRTVRLDSVFSFLLLKYGIKLKFDTVVRQCGSKSNIMYLCNYISKLYTILYSFYV